MGSVGNRRRGTFLGARFVDAIRSHSVNAKILRAGVLISALTCIAKVISVAKEVALASIFGRGAVIEAYLTAYVVPALILNITSGTIISVLVPYYAEVKARRGAPGASALSGNIVLVAGLLFVAVTVALAIFARPLISLMTPDLAADRRNLTIRLLIYMSPYVLLNGLAQVIGAVLNAEKRISAPAILQGMIPLGVIVFAWEFGQRWQGAALCIGTCVGALMQVILLAWAGRVCGIRFCIDWKQIIRHTKDIAMRAMPVFVGGLFMSSALMIDQIMSVNLGPGSISALVYGGRLVSLIQTVAAGAAATAILPYISEMVAQGQWAACKKTFLAYTKWLLVVAVPVTLILMLGSFQIVRVIYQHGAFHATDTALVARLQAILLAQIPFYIAAMATLQLLFAINASKWFAIGSLANLVLDVVMNYIFMNKWGVAGIAASTSLMYVCSFVFLFVLARRELGVRISQGIQVCATVQSC